jgi:hypothetical protein
MCGPKIRDLSTFFTFFLASGYRLQDRIWLPSADYRQENGGGRKSSATALYP